MAVWSLGATCDWHARVVLVGLALQYGSLAPARNMLRSMRGIEYVPAMWQFGRSMQHAEGMRNMKQAKKGGGGTWWQVGRLPRLLVGLSALAFAVAFAAFAAAFAAALSAAFAAAFSAAAAAAVAAAVSVGVVARRLSPARVVVPRDARRFCSLELRMWGDNHAPGGGVAVARAALDPLEIVDRHTVRSLVCGVVFARQRGDAPGRSLDGVLAAARTGHAALGEIDGCGRTAAPQASARLRKRRRGSPSQRKHQAATAAFPLGPGLRRATRGKLPASAVSPSAPSAPRAASGRPASRRHRPKQRARQPKDAAGAASGGAPARGSPCIFQP
eukprot:4388089-Prymnesium_polylepis.3